MLDLCATTQPVCTGEVNLECRSVVKCIKERVGKAIVSAKQKQHHLYLVKCIQAWVGDYILGKKILKCHHVTPVSIQNGLIEHLSYLILC